MGVNRLTMKVLTLDRSFLILFEMKLVLFFAILALYISTLCPTVGFIDSGELTTVSYTLGIAHPTGYPLYTIMGRMFTLIPFGNVALRVNLLSAILSALTIVILYSLISLCLGSSSLFPLLGSLLFAFSYVFWRNSTVAEVYPLTTFFTALLLLIFVKWQRKKETHILYLLFFLIGLAFCNHLIIFTVSVPVAVFVLKEKRPLFDKHLFNLCVLFILGLSLYLYLPIRATREPLLNWGNPTVFERFIWHITGMQYRVWMFSQSVPILGKRLYNYVRLLFEQYPPYILWVAPLGIIESVRKLKLIGWVMLSTFLLNIFYSINYDIPDIDSYFLISFLIVSIWLGFGFNRLFTSIFRLKKFAYILLGLCLIPAIKNYPRVNQRKNYIAYNYGMNVLKSVKHNGIVLTNLWDIYSPILYIRYVENKRRDVVMIDKELLRRSWYFKYLNREYPWLIEDSKLEVKDYLKLLGDFEHNRLKDPNEIQRNFIRMIDSFIYKNISERPVYTTFVNGYDRDIREIAPSLFRIPHGLIFQFDSTESYTPFSYDSFDLSGIFDESVYKDKRTKILISNYPKMMRLRELWLQKIGKYETH